MNTHELKTWPEFFEAVMAGVKPFEIRHNDRDFEVGDRLVLKEFKPCQHCQGSGIIGLTGQKCCDTPHGEFTNRSVERFVSYLTNFGQQSGMVVMGLSAIPAVTRISKNSQLAPSQTGLVTHSLTLTMKEVRDLAQFCGMVLTTPTPQEKEEERETGIVIAPWPEKGVRGDDGALLPRKYIAYYDEYPEEGCVPLGSPSGTPAHTNPRRHNKN